MDGDFQPAAPVKPGVAFHAPQARLVTEAGAPVTLGGKPVSPDIVSAKVTLPASGVGQVEIVLNNQRQDDAGRPVTPPWRYNGLKEVGFGARFRVDMRYGAEGWTPMILARVTDMSFAFPQSGPALVTLKGDDLVSLLRVNPDEDLMYVDFHEAAMVSDVLQSSASGLTLSNPPPTEFSQPMQGLTRKKSITYLKFIEDLAERMDYEIFAAFDDPSSGAAGASAADARTVGFHFEPSRSATLDAVVSLKWGRDIVDFAPTFTVWDMLTKVTARASVPRDRGEIEANAKLDDAINDLHASPSAGAAAPLAAGKARIAAFGDENHPEDNAATIPAPDLDAERAALAATAKLRASARRFLTADLTTIGFTRLRPGLHVDLSGFSAPFDGVWYVVRTVHTLSASGYLTVSSLRRPGMLDPAGYPGA